MKVETREDAAADNRNEWAELFKTEFDAKGKQVSASTWKNGIEHGPLRELNGRRQ